RGKTASPFNKMITSSINSPDNFFHIYKFIDFIINVLFGRDVNNHGGLLAKNIWKVDRRK
ncbi:hypothetical protein, partial [Escherichia coli]